MNIIGQDPKRDKKAHRIIYGSYYALSGVLSVVKSCMGVPGNIGSQSEVRKQRDKAWKIYSETGDIKKAVTVLVWDP